TAKKQRLAKRRHIQRGNVAALRRCNYKTDANRLEKCLLDADAANDLDLPRYASPIRCHLRYCVFCGPKIARARARRLLSKLYDKIKPGRQVTASTLTVPNTPNLERAHYNHIFECFK